MLPSGTTCQFVKFRSEVAAFGKALYEGKGASPWRLGMDMKEELPPRHVRSPPRKYKHCWGECVDPVLVHMLKKGPKGFSIGNIPGRHCWPQAERDKLPYSLLCFRAYRLSGRNLWISEETYCRKVAFSESDLHLFSPPKYWGIGGLKRRCWTAAGTPQKRISRGVLFVTFQKRNAFLIYILQPSLKAWRSGPLHHHVSHMHFRYLR